MSTGRRHYTRHYRRDHNVQLADFDLDPFLSNCEHLPPPQLAAPEVGTSSVALAPEIFSDSPLTSLSSLMAPMTGNAVAGPSGSTRDPDVSSSPSPVREQPPQPDHSQSSQTQQRRPSQSQPVHYEDGDKRPQDYKVEKFLEASVLKADGSNFVTWKRRIVIALRNKKWEDYALGRVSCPDENNDPRGFSVWRHVDSLVAGQISSNMEDSLFGEISTDEMTSSELWAAIITRFEESSELAQTTIYTRLCGKRIHEGESMKDHILELRKLKAEYANRGGNLTKAQWHSVIVSSLEQHSYWHQMDLFADVIDDPEKLIKTLELKELRGGGRTANSNAALQVQHMQPAPVNRFQDRMSRPTNLSCNVCRRRGHSAQNCYAPGGGAAHRRPAWYRVPPHLLEKERAQLSAQIRAIDQQRAQVASSLNYSEPRVASPALDPMSSTRHEILMAVNVAPLKNSDTWILDSGATSHMTFVRDHFVEYHEIAPLPIYTARESNLLYAVGTGTIRIVFKVGLTEVPALISNVLYVPEICANLISLAKLDERGVTYHGGLGEMQFWNGPRLIACATKRDGQWLMETAPSLQTVHLTSTKQDTVESLAVWHRRLAHVSQQRILDLNRNQTVIGLDVSDSSPNDCEACVLSKMAAIPAEPKPMRAQKPGDIIHSDIEFMGHRSFSQAEYSLKFVDEFSNYLWVYALKDKQASTVHSIWSNLCSFFLTQFSIRVKALHSDNGSEFVNGTMDKYNSDSGIEHHKIAPRRHEMNGRAERMNRTGSNAVRSMLLTAGLPEAYWAEAYDTFAYIHNRTSISGDRTQTPFEVLYNRKPDLSHIRVFGCAAYMRIPPEERKKLDSKARKLVMIGYRDDAAYRLFDPQSRKVFYSRDVAFDESGCFHVDSTQPQASIEEVHDTVDPSPPTVTDHAIVRRSTRVAKPTKRLLESIEQERSLSYLDNPQRLNVARERRYVAGIPIPRDATEAFQSAQSEEWIAAMQYEITKLESMQCWDVVERPNDAHIIAGLWVFNLKQEVDGSLEFRARWVARGDSQIPGLEFDDTFASAGDYVIARIVFAHSSKQGRSLVTLDINSAYLHSPLPHSNLFVNYPTGFAPHGLQHPCCHLRKALYGLRQGARAWEQHLSDKLKSIGFRKCVSAPSAYFRSTDKGEDILATHVDDLQNSSEPLVNDGTQAFKDDIKTLFDYKEKDTRNKAKVLGITIENDESNNKVKLSVGSRITAMLERYHMENAKAVDSPMLTDALATFDSDTSEGYERPPWPYAQLVGELLWVGNAVRPDIAFTVNVLARYLKKPKDCHWEAAKRVLRYLKRTRDLGIAYKASDDTSIVGFCDSDWATDPSNRKSTTGYVFTYAGGAISWKSRKQTVVSTSTAEAEYLAASTATNEAKWLRSFFSEINRPQNAPTTIFVDNTASISMTRDPVYHSKTKHIDIRAHHLRDEVNKRTILLQYVPGEDNPADVLTKALTPALHHKCIGLLGME